MKHMVKVGGKEYDYADLLSTVQRHVSENYASEIAGMSERADSEQRMTDIVHRSLINIGVLEPSDAHNPIINQVYEDMAGMSFLGKYLKHLDQYPDLEEINGQSWNSITFKYSGGRTEFKNRDGEYESFLSPQHSVEVINRIIGKHKSVLDDATCEITSDYGENIRITAKKYPTIPREFGVDFSIRITRPHEISHDRLIDNGTLSADCHEFLRCCTQYLISICVSGKQNAGKTTMINYLLSMLSPELRIYLIEEGSRELSLIKYDKSGRMLNQVIPNLTRPDSKNSETNFDAKKLLQFGLRYDVDVFVPQEIRDEVAITAVECARTGSMVITSIHANDAINTYSRIMTLMQLSSTQSEDTLMRLAVDAFPLIIHMRRLKDGQPRVLEVLEGERYDRERGVIGRTLYRYTVEENVLNEDETTSVHGHFERVHGISEGFQRKLLNAGAPLKLVEKYAKEGAD